MSINVSSFKVEGRMKSIHYVATVTACYRNIIDAYINKKNIDIDKIKRELQKAENRLTSSAFFDKNPNETKMLYFEEERELLQNFAFVFTEKISDTEYKIHSKNYFTKNSKFEILMPDLNNIEFNIVKIKNNNNEYIEIVNQPSTDFFITVDKPLENVVNKIVRVVKKDS